MRWPGRRGWLARTQRREAKGRRRRDDLDSLSRDELYDRAQERDIDGRSTMSKDALLAALRHAS